VVNTKSEINPSKKEVRAFNTDLLKFRWSFHRHIIFKECLRKYFLHYIVPRLDCSQVEENLKKNALFLKQLVNRFMLMGEVVHQEILNWIQSYHRDQPFTLAEVVERAWQAFLQKYEFSRRECYFFHPTSDPLYTVLFEHVYKQPVSSYALGEVYRMIKRAFRNLSVWSGFQRLQVLDSARVVYQDELLQAELKGLPLWVKVDYGYVELDGQPVLIDWKLSRQLEEKDRIQLAVYGAFAYGANNHSSSIRLVNFYLLPGTVVEFYLDKSLFQATIAFIQRSFQEMRDFHLKVVGGYGLKDLPPAYQQEVCRHCNFRKICFPAGIPAGNVQQVSTVQFKSNFLSKEGR